MSHATYAGTFEESQAGNVADHGKVALTYFCHREDLPAYITGALEKPLQQLPPAAAVFCCAQG
jgi:hypothetical protein